MRDEILTLERVYSRKRPRLDWDARWFAACKAVNYKGVVKTKDGSKKAWRSSPVWKALGQGKGGFRDCTLSSEPPFAFNSGIGWTHEKEKKKEIDEQVQKKLASKEFKDELKKQLGLKDITITIKI